LIFKYSTSQQGSNSTKKINNTYHWRLSTKTSAASVVAIALVIIIVIVIIIVCKIYLYENGANYLHDNTLVWVGSTVVKIRNIRVKTKTRVKGDRLEPTDESKKSQSKKNLRCGAQCTHIYICRLSASRIRLLDELTYTHASSNIVYAYHTEPIECQWRPIWLHTHTHTHTHWNLWKKITVWTLVRRFSVSCHTSVRAETRAQT